jgi:hypothetical protein
MSNSTIPLRVKRDGTGNTDGLAEFQTGENVGLEHGGTGASNAAEARTNLELANVAVSSDYADLLNKPVLKTERYFINSAANSWIIQHNKGTSSFHEKLFEADGSQFFAYVETIDVNSFKIHLSETITGYVDVIFDNVELLP